MLLRGNVVLCRASWVISHLSGHVWFFVDHRPESVLRLIFGAGLLAALFREFQALKKDRDILSVPEHRLPRVLGLSGVRCLLREREAWRIATVILSAQAVGGLPSRADNILFRKTPSWASNGPGKMTDECCLLLLSCFRLWLNRMAESARLLARLLQRFPRLRAATLRCNGVQKAKPGCGISSESADFA